MAEIYDYVMRHVDYVGWADYMEALFLRFEFDPSSIVDLACGTGTLSYELYQRGYKVTGVDGSDGMLAVARRKAAAAKAEISFLQSDLRGLRNLPTFDAALCLYDSLNYMRTKKDILQTFEAVWPIVEPGGLFIFDICTESNSLRYFRDETDRERGDRFSYVRRSMYDPEEQIQLNQFEIEFYGEEKIIVETHKQRGYPKDTVIALIERSSFSLLGAYDGFTFIPAHEDSDRIHFVLRR